MKKIKLLIGFTALLLLIIPFGGFAQTINGSFMHNGLQRDYVLYIPANYTGNSAVPLILNFHGFGGNGQQQMQNSGFKSIADTAGFIVVSPTGTPLPIVSLNHWNVGGWTNTSTVNDVDFSSTLIDSIAATYNINLQRVYSTGFSNGGFFSHKLACELDSRIAAIASVSGTFTPEMQSNCSPTHPTPVMQIHGTTDATVPYNGTTGNGGMAAVDTVLDYWITYNNCNTTPTINTLPDLNTNDGSTVEHFIYSGGNAGTTVELLKVTGGGHNWPGTSGNMDIIASLEIWKFFSKYTNSAVGIHDINHQAQIRLYPNPASNSIFIKGEIQNNSNYKIYSVLGKQVTSGNINAKQSEINISNLNEGLYFVELNHQVFKILKRP